MLTWQAPVPEQAPFQPAKVESAAGVAVNVTAVFSADSTAQLLPQSMPSPVTVPAPLPSLLTVSV
ncbi:MAG: hypothetical protein DRR08_15645 [Candidatus Parabeggiatoa sp. nov. 2]|nr:MAG: hypothetical protein B6247_24600 [Beggiatoa sp. 4572_84]RKZ58753.1 MAG: hypothetical protein DRR08_15645 [Gammaproteobacteria bacterium]